MEGVSMKKKVLATIMAAAMSLTMLVGCGSEGGGDATAPETDAGGEATAEAGDAGEAPAADGDVITVGFAQVGHESDWRTASTTSYFVDAVLNTAPLVSSDPASNCPLSYLCLCLMNTPRHFVLSSDAGP